jgi:(p)ppGpp synthase/HD superfamily hydrolase
MQSITFFSTHRSVAMRSAHRVHFAGIQQIAPATEKFNRRLVQKLLRETAEKLKSPVNHAPEAQLNVVQGLLGELKKSGAPAVLMQCIEYGTEAHKNQKFGALPYNYHILSVAMYVAQQGGRLVDIMAGVLHDVVEDQGGEPRLLDIKNRFGDGLADIVLGCSYDPTPTFTFNSRQEKWVKNQMALLKHMESASPAVRMVKMADMKHNVTSSAANVLRAGPSFMDTFALGKMGELWKQFSRVERLKKTEGSNPFLRKLEKDLTRLTRLCNTTVDAVRQFNPWDSVPKHPV